MAKNTNKMLLVHLSQTECQAFDMMQGGESLNEDGIPEYSKVGELIKVPEVREVFTRALNYFHDNGGQFPPEVKEMSENIKKQAPIPVKSKAERRDPFLKELESMGTEGDTRIASIPENMAEFLIELKGRPQENPHTGLLMFGGSSSSEGGGGRDSKPDDGGFLGTALPLLGAIVGNFVAPGVGGMLVGSALGSAAGRVGSGQSGSDLWGGIGRDVGRVGIASMFGPMGGAMSYFGSSPGARGVSDPNTILAADVGKVRDVTAGGALRAAQSAAPQAAPQSSGLMDFLSHPLTALGISGAASAMAYAGQRQQHAAERRQRERDAAEFRSRTAYLHDPWVKVKPAEIQKNPNYWTGTGDFDRKYGVMQTPFTGKGYAHGGPVSHQDHSFHKEGSFIQGPGKGQDDVISTRVPHNSYIIDASTVADFGDGSSRAGAQVLKDFEKKIRSRFGHSHSTQPSDVVPVYLSDGEFRFSHDFVNDLGKLGNGGTDLGAKLLKKMTIGIRKHKNGSGDKLPPKAKDPFYYIQKEASNLLKRRA